MNEKKIMAFIEETLRDERDEYKDMPDKNCYASGYCRGTIDALENVLDRIKEQQ